jgi:UDP-2,3-diacylglucosamine pyrophosphatase LpxH
MSPIHVIRPLKYRAIWISDVHLGSKYSRAEFLLDFLKSTECEYLYLVGDIVDLWSMRRSVHWPQSHNNVIRAILGKAKRGTKIIYIPGNHDALVRDFESSHFGEVEIKNHAIHTTADGKKLLVLHGDEFDNVIRCNGLTSLLGNVGYDLLMWINRVHNHLRRLCNLPYWSLASYLKHRVKNAREYIQRFEAVVAKEAKRRGVDGLVCGHLHRPELTYIDDVLYCNDGDWVETCTALVEHHDGSLQLLHWADEKRALKDMQVEGSLSCVS